ncbi:MAG: hypothetical protein K2M64_02280, partial [Clostridia bacterium]|nr:hypothetical protein [Clostridia bacterium]
MKKFLSIFIVMLMVVSLFITTTVVAFAAEGDETDKITVSYVLADDDKDKADGTAPDPKEIKTGEEFKLEFNMFTPKKGYEFAGWRIEGDETSPALIEGDTYTMPEHSVVFVATWTDARKIDDATINDKLMTALAQDEFFKSLKWQMDDIAIGKKLMEENAAANLKDIFGDELRYVEEDTDTQKKNRNDKVVVEYCRPSESPKGQESWQNSATIATNFKLSSSGWYLFRIVVKDYSGNNVIYAGQKFSRYAEDTQRPVVELSATMKDKEKNGLTVKESYDPSTSLTITDASSTTVTYVINKKVNGDWVLIYDSKTKEVTEGYEKFVSTTGRITPSKEDVSTEFVYQIIYSVVDTNGYEGVSELDKDKIDAEVETPILNLFVNPEKVDKTAVNAWTIVLFSIAGVAAVGIIVLLFIKP